LTELPMHIKSAVRKYEPIDTDGLTLYPVLVKEYDTFLMARPALEVLQQSFPVRLMRVPLLTALYQMDYEAVTSGQMPTGLFSRALLAIALSLRLGEGLDPAERMRQFRVAVDREKPETLLRLEYAVGGETKEITPLTFQKVRPIIAAQNGVKLESDMADPDLVQAEKDLAEQSGVSLNANVDDLVSAISALSGNDEADIEEWPILKLQRRQTAYKRMLDYLVCGFGQVNGTTWKGGNPVPHPFFDRIESGGFGAHMALRDFAGGAGERAVANAGQQTS